NWFRDFNGDIRETALIDLTGKVLVATDREERLTGRLLPYRYVQQGLSGSPAISDLHFLNREADLTPNGCLDEVEALELSRPTITYVHPIRDKNAQVVGLAAVWVRAGALWRILKDGRHQAGPGSSISLYDNAGVCIG